jgi:hypothetical protein
MLVLLRLLPYLDGYCTSTSLQCTCWCEFCLGYTGFVGANCIHCCAQVLRCACAEVLSLPVCMQVPVQALAILCAGAGASSAYGAPISLVLVLWYLFFSYLLLCAGATVHVLRYYLYPCAGLVQYVAFQCAGAAVHVLRCYLYPCACRSC